MMFVRPWKDFRSHTKPLVARPRIGGPLIPQYYFLDNTMQIDARDCVMVGAVCETRGTIFSDKE